MAKKLTLGIDLGGTGIKFGIVGPEGELIKHLRLSTPSKKDPIEVIELIIDQAQLLIEASGHQRVQAIGVGTAGDVDPDSGVIRISPNLNWHNVPLKQMLAKKLKYPIFVDNDANVAAWAAFVVEAKRRIKNLLCITVGTGVGGGIVLNGALYRGTTGSAGEVGHMTLYPEGVPCPCGNHGCLERYVGARAMADEARRAIAAGESTMITHLVKNDLSAIDPRILDQAARLKDPVALRLWSEVGERLGTSLAALINVLNPEWIVLAGGLSKAGNLLLDPVRRTILRRSFPTPGGAAKLIISKLDQDLGVVGAGLIAHEGYAHQRN